MSTTVKHVTGLARSAGYQVIQVEQLRTNRWVLLLEDGCGDKSMVMVQERALVSAADVQDLADLLRLRNMPSGTLLALGGKFSPVAERTVLELRDSRISLCTSLPPAPSAPDSAPALSVT